MEASSKLPESSWSPSIVVWWVWRATHGFDGSLNSEWKAGGSRPRKTPKLGETCWAWKDLERLLFKLQEMQPNWLIESSRFLAVTESWVTLQKEGQSWLYSSQMKIFHFWGLCSKVFLQVKQVLLHKHKLGYEAHELGCWKVGSWGAQMQSTRAWALKCWIATAALKEP